MEIGFSRGEGEETGPLRMSQKFKMSLEWRRNIQEGSDVGEETYDYKVYSGTCARSMTLTDEFDSGKDPSLV